jgi:hypothetical protein
MKHPVSILSFQDESENVMKGLYKEISWLDNHLVTGTHIEVWVKLQTKRHIVAQTSQKM